MPRGKGRGRSRSAKPKIEVVAEPVTEFLVPDTKEDTSFQKAEEPADTKIAKVDVQSDEEMVDTANTSSKTELTPEEDSTLAAEVDVFLKEIKEMSENQLMGDNSDGTTAGLGQTSEMDQSTVRSTKQPAMLLNEKIPGLKYEITRMSDDPKVPECEMKVCVNGEDFLATARSKRLAKQEVARLPLMKFFNTVCVPGKSILIYYFIISFHVKFQIVFYLNCINSV
ncbi:hypothetical protein SNE40_008848 [Patella caerulea]|uniref:DRBM domain-containing protein n=1 Tax=Patella caerulea TaxID=87958 RepID=A0AAN8JTM8_PATCE